MTAVGTRRRGPAPPPVDEEKEALFTAALGLIIRDGTEHLTVAGILAEAGLASRAFYRHFASKDEFLTAIWLRETARSVVRLRARVAAAAPGMAEVDAWVDDRLDRVFAVRGDLGYETLWRNGVWLRGAHPVRYTRVMEPPVDVLRTVIEAGAADGHLAADADPDLDAWTIHAALWVLAERHFDGGDIGRAEAKAHMTRVVRGLLGGPPGRRGRFCDDDGAGGGRRPAGRRTG